MITHLKYSEIWFSSTAIDSPLRFLTDRWVACDITREETEEMLKMRENLTNKKERKKGHRDAAWRTCSLSRDESGGKQSLLGAQRWSVKQRCWATTGVERIMTQENSSTEDVVQHGLRTPRSSDFTQQIHSNGQTCWPVKRIHTGPTYHCLIFLLKQQRKQMLKPLASTANTYTRIQTICQHVFCLFGCIFAFDIGFEHFWTETSFKKVYQHKSIPWMHTQIDTLIFFSTEESLKK